MSESLKLGAILFLITSLCVGSLGLINSKTTPIIALNSSIAEQDAMKELILEADNFKEVEKVDDEEISKLFVAQKEGESIGVVAKVLPNGYGGPIEMLVGLDSNNAVTGIKILALSETPGLGANAKNEDFINQFKEKIAPLEVVKGESKDNEISAITGATITSKAVAKGVNVAADYVSKHQSELFKEVN